MNKIRLTQLIRDNQLAIESNGAIPVDVPCGSCSVCCSLPVQLTPDEAADPFYNDVSQGDNGECKMLIEGKCAIYENRPASCKAFDCRLGLISNAIGIRRDIRPATEFEIEYDNKELLLTVLFAMAMNILAQPRGTMVKILWQQTIASLKDCKALLKNNFGMD